MKTYIYPIVVKPLEDQEGYYAECPVIQGAHTIGDTPEAAIDNLKDAIRAILVFKEADTVSYLPYFDENLKEMTFALPLTV